MRAIVKTVLACLIISLVLSVSFSYAAAPAALNETTVRRLLMDYLQQKMQYLDVEIKIKKLGFANEIKLPLGDMDYEVVAPQDWEGWGKGSVALIVRSNERILHNIPLNIEVEALSLVVVTTRPLEKGEIIDRSAVTVQKRDLASIPAKTSRNISDVIGKRVRVGMRGNSALRADYIENPPLIKSGQAVTILVENSAFRVTASGRAKSNGAAGETVMVQNMSALKDIPAIVVDANTVRVEY